MLPAELLRVTIAAAVAAPRGEPRRGAVVAGLGVGQILAWGSSYYLPAVIAHPVTAATGWPLPGVVGGLSLGLFAAGLVSPLVGRMIERTGGRPVLALGSLLLGLGLAGLAAAPNLACFLAAWVVIGLGMGAALYDAAFATLGRLYGQGARGAITSLTLFGGFASTVCWPLSTLLVEWLGWRGTCLAYAAVQLGLVLPMHLLLLPRQGSAAPTGAASDPAASVGDTAPSDTALRGCARAAFLLLAATLTIGSALQGVVAVHLLTMLHLRGLATAAAVTLGALVGPSQVLARLIEKLVASRLHPIWTMVASAALTAGGLLLLWAGFPVVAVCLVCYGAGIGLSSIARGTLPLALFGSAGYAVRMGRLAAPMLVAGALAPSAGAAVLDRFGAGGVLATLAVTAVANAVLVLILLVLVRDRLSSPGAP